MALFVAETGVRRFVRLTDGAAAGLLLLSSCALYALDRLGSGRRSFEDVSFDVTRVFHCSNGKPPGVRRYSEYSATAALLPLVG